MAGRGRVFVVRTGTANVASVCAAIERLGARAVVTEDPELVGGCDRLVLPGVGTLAAAMERLDELALVEPLRRRIRAGQPTLAVCLGMQMLCGGSAESPGVEGLGILEAEATGFSRAVRVPQLGWNDVAAADGCRVLCSGSFYFANSYRLETAPAGWLPAIADYGGPFVAALERGDVVACQFHPELSSGAGLGLIGRWLEGAGGGAPC